MRFERNSYGKGNGMAITIIFQLVLLLFFAVPAWAQFGGPGLRPEDVPHVSGDLGRPVWGVRQSIQADFGADGDYVPLSIDDNGNLRVIGSSTTEYTEDEATANPIIGIATVMERDDQLSNVSPAASRMVMY